MVKALQTNYTPSTKQGKELEQSDFCLFNIYKPEPGT